MFGGWIAPSVAAGLARYNHHFGPDPVRGRTCASQAFPMHADPSGCAKLRRRALYPCLEILDFRGRCLTFTAKDPIGWISSTSNSAITDNTFSRTLAACNCQVIARVASR